MYIYFLCWLIYKLYEISFIEDRFRYPLRRPPVDLLGPRCFATLVLPHVSRLIHYFLGRQLFHVSVHIVNEDNSLSANNKPDDIAEPMCLDLDASKRKARVDNVQGTHRGYTTLDRSIMITRIGELTVIFLRAYIIRRDV